MKTAELINNLIYQWKAYLAVITLWLTVPQQQEECDSLKDR